MGKASKKKKMRRTASATGSLSEAEAVPMERLLPKKGTFLLHILLIATIGILVYSNTFSVPFVLDDHINIVINPVIKDLDYFQHPTKAKVFINYESIKRRYITHLSFALNYRVHGLDVMGYHVVNLIIHIFNAFLVYFLIILTSRTALLNKMPSGEKLALFSAVLFVSHPLQTQAVTYIVQRTTSLATLFYLTSLVAYIRSRFYEREPTGHLLYAVSIVSAVLAMKTKEIAFTLPLAVVLYEFMFFTREHKTRLLRLLPLVLTILVIPLGFLISDKPLMEILDNVKRSQDISRIDYLLTEMRVLVTYLRLLFIPVNQNADYDYPVYDSFLDPPVLLSFLFLLSIFGFGIYLLYRSRITDHGLRLVSFGIFWFFLTLSVESSIIPLKVIFEHRVYLPSAGIFLAFGSGVFLVLSHVRSKPIRAAVVTVLVMLPLALSYATYTRNAIWGSQRSLWEDVLRKSPNSARAHINVGTAYQADGLLDKATVHYRTAIMLNPDLAEAYNNIALIYLSKGLTDKAIENLQTAIRLAPELVVAYTTLADAYLLKGLTDNAIENYRTALMLRPDYADAHNNIATAYLRKGMTDKALEHYRTAVRLKPDLAVAHLNLGVIYIKKGLPEKARRELENALRIKPDYHKARKLLEGLSGKRNMMPRN
jgi:Tfp pilus assembly protein PilF